MNIVPVKTRSIMFRYPLEDWDLNVHLIMGNKYNYLIDTGLGSLSMEPIKDYLIKSSLPLIVINTHYHWDHIWGNIAFPNSTIISHKRCYELIKSTWEETIEKQKQYISGEIEMILPNLVFDNNLYFPEDKIHIFYTPGHTTDSISVFDEMDGVLNVGDNIGDSLSEILPSLEVESSVYANTLSKYQELSFDTCISGHNQILGKDVVQMILDKL